MEVTKYESAENLERKRWLIAAAAVVMQLCLGTVYAWSVFKKPLMTSHGWSETATQANIYDINGCHRHLSGLRGLFSR